MEMESHRFLFTCKSIPQSFCDSNEMGKWQTNGKDEQQQLDDVKRRIRKKTKHKYRVERARNPINFPFALPSFLPIFLSMHSLPMLFLLFSCHFCCCCCCCYCWCCYWCYIAFDTQQPTKEPYNRNSKLTTWVCPHHCAHCTQFLLLRFHSYFLSLSLSRSVVFRIYNF